MPRYVKPAARTFTGSRMLRPSRKTGLLHQALQPLEVGRAVLVPLRQEQHGVGARRRLVGIVGVLDLDLARAWRSCALRLGIDPDDLGARPHELARHHERRRLAHVVGLRLERQPPEGEPLALQVLAEDVLHLLDEDAASASSFTRSAASTISIGTPCCRPRVQERLRVLREARAAVAAARVEERRADARVGPDALPDLLDVDAEASQSRAISFMNEIRVASMALAAYFVISAASFDMRRIGLPDRTNGA